MHRQSPPPLRKELSSACMRSIAASDPLIDPPTDFLIHPGDPTLAQHDPVREFACLLEPRDVLEAVGDTECFQLLFRYQ